MNLIWTPSARLDLREIISFVTERNVSAADRLGGLIERAAESLAAHPSIGRPGRIPGTREFVVHPNYILIYEVSRDQLTVIAVLHARQQYP